MKNQESKSMAFPLFVNFTHVEVAGKTYPRIKNIAVGTTTSLKEQVAQTMASKMVRVGTIHAQDLWVEIHKGYSNGNEKTRFYPLSKEEKCSMEYPRYRVFMSFGDDQFGFVYDENGKQKLNELGFPLVDKITQVKFMDLVAADNAEKIKEYIDKKYMSMPMTLITSNPDELVVTFYARNGSKVFLRPRKVVAPQTAVVHAEPISKEAIVEHAAEVMAEASDAELFAAECTMSNGDDLPF